jgi:eukaryotic-like serine/threonine-protein kinase
LEPGLTIAHYRILSSLGQGGMGVVYVAEDLRLGRRVALKFLAENSARDPIAFQRLQREARTACRLNHPNICTIHEVEEYERQPVIVMELLEGQTLKERLRETPLTFQQVLEIATQVADALEVAHSAGIIHRDIKPANIFMTKRGAVKVLDFGLAKLVPRMSEGTEAATTPEALEESLTAVGVIPGTTTYMSPEQIKGDELDFRTDLFSLGIVLYEMATGQQPFKKKNAVLTMEAILNLRPKPASSLNPEIPGEFDSILDKLLEKDRTQRYQTTNFLREALEQVKQSKLAVRKTPSPQKLEMLDQAAGELFDTVQIFQQRTGKQTPTRQRSIPRVWKIAVAAFGVFIFIAGILFYSHRSTALRETDSIVLADFENKTGDPVFDDTLKQALAVDLGQSPFLNIISDRKMTATLLLMGRSPDKPVTGAVARELCQRVGSKAMLAGSISALGSTYVIGLNAINCSSGETLVREQVEAHRKEDVLKALGNAATDMRGKLGESLSSIQRFAAPIEEATTPSLEALQAYSMARRAAYAKGDIAAIPYYQRALELDPNFALTYRGLAVSYSNLGQTTRALENVKKAFDLRERVSEREKYAITARYYSDFTGELEKANQAYELFEQSYPRDFLATLNLADNYMRLGEWQKALASQEESLKEEPNSSVSNSNLAWMQLALERPDDAAATLKQALARHMDSLFLRLALYQTAFIKGDNKKMDEQLAWARGRAGEEDWLLSTQSDTQAYFGHLTKARELSKQAVTSGIHADARETAALWQANAALREAEFGNLNPARQYALSALSLVEGKAVESVAAMTFAQAGDTAQATKVAEKLNRGFAQDTIIQGYWLPSIRAAIELHGNNHSKAIEILQTTAPYELCQSQPFQLGMLYPIYLRGQAFLQAGQGTEAAGEFQKIIDHRGIVLNFPLGALAHLGLGRAYALRGNTTAARAAYQDFFALWKDADPDIPILRQAKGEYATLQRLGTTN